jgi:hypothetical protein
MPLATFSIAETELRPESPLSSGVVHFRVRAINEDAEFGVLARSDWSAVWWTRIPTYDTDVVSSTGTDLDLDGDGRAELVVTTDAGVWKVFPGSPGGPDAASVREIPDPPGWPNPSSTLIPIGDIDGDGDAELLVMIPSQPARELQEAGGALEWGARTTSGTFSRAFASSLQALGDLEGDGYGDIAIWGLPSPLPGNPVMIFSGSASGLRSEPTMVLTPPHGSEESLFGESLAAGDFDGDGAPDLAVGAPDADGQRGSVFAFSPLTTAPVELSMPSSYRFGVQIEAADLDADGRSDLIIAGEAVYDLGTKAEMRFTRICFYQGTSSGLDPSPWAVFELYGQLAYGMLGSYDADRNPGVEVLLFLTLNEPSYPQGLHTFRAHAGVIEHEEGAVVPVPYGTTTRGVDLDGDGLRDVAAIPYPAAMDANTVHIFSGGRPPVDPRVLEVVPRGSMVGWALAGE